MPKPKKMKLWLISANSYGYDDYTGFVVRAPTEVEARQIAQEKVVYQDGVFTDQTKSSCVEVKANGQATIILDSFHAG